MGLSTHVLDTVHGRPAAGMAIELFESGDGRTMLKRGVTDANGRMGPELLGADALRRGRYELVFDVAGYFRAVGVALPDPPFLERVTIAFGVAEPGAHYHVPLLVSPWSYATYRGS